MDIYNKILYSFISLLLRIKFAANLLIRIIIIILLLDLILLLKY